MARWRIRVAGVVFLLLLLTGSLLLRPVDTAGLTSRPLPAATYAEAMARGEALLGRDGTQINPICRSRLLTHGQRTASAIVLLYGFTNCPQQFAALGQQLYERGYNVVIPRQPHHGLANRLTEELALLTAEEMAVAADEAVDIDHGLSDRVSVMGLSTGGVMTAWLAQERADVVHHAVVLVPLFGRDGPTLLARPTTQLALLLPNQFIWWSEEAKRTATTDTFHAYPRYSTRAGGEVMRLGEAVLQAAERAPPRAQAMTVVTVENDNRVGNALTSLLVQRWQARQALVMTYQFPAHQRILHDLIDPSQAEQRIDIVYPKLIELLKAHS
jgi:carboxylesterase